MPKPFQYRAGSLIYYQGDTADKIFILQNGKVSLVYKDIETGEDVKDQVQPGEFFGVKSALGSFPREENAFALSETTVMAFTVPEFEALAAQNIRIIIKMLKVLSTQMRKIHRQVSSLMEKEEVKPDEGLYNVGEYYLKNKKYSHAKYVFSQYLTYYPSGKNALQATKNLMLAENSIRGIVTKGQTAAPAAAPVQAASPVPAAPAAAEPVKLAGSAADAYYNAVSLISQEKYQEAIISFKRIIDAKQDQEWVARSSFEIGRCMFMLKKYPETIKYYSSMLTQYPKHPELKDTMFIIGQCNEKMGRNDQAAAFYKKILSMGSSDENDGITVKVKRALSALGV